MQELAASAGMGSVVPDESGYITLLFDSEHEVVFIPEDDGVATSFHCELGDASQIGSDGCRVLLEASFAQTEGAAFAIQPELQRVKLWKRFGEFASPSELENAINDFLGQVVAWKHRLKTGDFFALEPSELLLQYMGLSSNFIQV